MLRVKTSWVDDCVGAGFVSEGSRGWILLRLRTKEPVEAVDVIFICKEEIVENQSKWVYRLTRINYIVSTMLLPVHEETLMSYEIFCWENNFIFPFFGEGDFDLVESERNGFLVIL